MKHNKIRHCEKILPREIFVAIHLFVILITSEESQKNKSVIARFCTERRISVIQKLT